ncbi:prepilin peptidase [Mycobacterium yunnanensis]|uniref:Prepilin peptidase n=1 Tax=Mycobacterium yunnanensis TaxID=368477 RepID=A0A9X3C400_9MYCO|nr:prepilin peptidase [Mycobacterium yunnanensis]
MGLGAAGAWLIALIVFDVTQRRLPNALTLPGAVAVLTVAAIAGRGPAAAVGALALAAVYLVVHLVAPAAMGGGDVKLALGLGGLSGAFGVDAWVLAAVVAPLLTAVWGLLVLATGSGTRHAAVPHGPSMCVATAAAVALVLT